MLDEDKQKRAVILVNLGTPEQPDAGSVRRFSAPLSL